MESIIMPATFNQSLITSPSHVFFEKLDGNFDTIYTKKYPTSNSMIPVNAPINIVAMSFDTDTSFIAAGHEKNRFTSQSYLEFMGNEIRYCF